MNSAYSGYSGNRSAMWLLCVVIAILTGIIGAAVFSLHGGFAKMTASVDRSSAEQACRRAHHDLMVAKKQIARMRREYLSEGVAISFFPITSTLTLPISPPFNIAVDFLEEKTYKNVFWGKHLGVDLRAKPGTLVYAAGDGVLRFSGRYCKKYHRGVLVRSRNWGGIIVLQHFFPRGYVGKVSGSSTFASVYGNLRRSPTLKRVKFVRQGDLLGWVAEANTCDSGWNEIAHLHFAIYTPDEWEFGVPPGFYRKDQRITTLAHWRHPLRFVNTYGTQYVGTPYVRSSNSIRNLPRKRHHHN